MTKRAKIFLLASRAGALIFLLCAVIPLLYGIFNLGTAAFYLLSAWFYFLPATWKLLGALPALRILLTVLMCVFFLYCACASIFMARAAWFAPPPGEGEATVIVLGAKVNGSQPSLMLKRRLNAAYGYLMGNPEAVCVVTGGQGSDERYPEAYVMKIYLESLGIPQERIYSEDNSSNTKQNFRYSAQYVRKGAPVVIITDSFHQLRAAVCAREELAELRPQGFYAVSSPTPWGLAPSYWIRDMLGVSFAWLEYRIA